MKQTFYRPELDVLRFWAFLQVFLIHFSDIYLKNGDGLLGSNQGWKTDFLRALIQSGSLGVDLFFCLSSFLITSLLLREYDQQGMFGLKKFWIRRALRIWPLYFVFLAAAIFVLPHLNFEPVAPKYIPAFLLFCGNWASVLWDWPSLTISILWSISVEEQFYLVWPLLLRIFSPAKLVPLAIGGLVLASVTRIILVAAGMSTAMSPVIWANTFARIDPIAIGALFAVVVRSRAWSPSLGTRAILAVVGTSIPMLMIRFMGEDNAFAGWGSIVFYPVVALCCVSLLAAIYQQEYVRMPSILIYLGRISYGLYVFHMVTLTFVSKRMPIPVDHGFLSKAGRAGSIFVLALGGTILIAMISYKFLEQPFLKIKEKKFTDISSSPSKAVDGKA